MYIFLIAALSTDGFIAQHTNQASTDWTSQADKTHFNQLTKEIGVLVMGRTTFGTIGFPLPGRLNIVYTDESKAEFGQQFQLSQKQLSDKILRVTTLDPVELCSQLEAEGFAQLAVCGGSSIYTQFMQASLVDKLFLTVEPVVFGDGIKLFNQPVEQKLTLVNSQQLNETGTLLLEYDCG